MIKEITEIRLKAISAYEYEATFYNSDGKRANTTIKVKTIEEINVLDKVLREINKKIREANLNKRQGRLF